MIKMTSRDTQVEFMSKYIVDMRFVAASMRCQIL